MTEQNPAISIIAWNVNGLNTTIKKQTLSELKYKTQLCAAYKKSISNIKTQ